MAIKLIVKKTEAAGSSSVNEMVLDEELITIGNGDGATLFLDDSQIENEQAVVVSENGKTVFISRAEGTILNDVLISRETRCEVQNGDEVQFGAYTISFLNTNFQPKPLNIQSENGSNGFSGHEPETGFEALPAAEENGNVPSKSFADILSSLRKEEDRFYFQLEGPDGPGRIPVEKNELTLGWDLTGRILSADPNIVVVPRASAVKDWSGVMLNPQGKDFVWINGESLSSPKRLADGDRLTFQSAFSSGPQKDTSLLFCEPASLVEINSLLPQELPSVAPDRRDHESEADIDQAENTISIKSAKGKLSKPQKKKKSSWFGYFSFGEVAFMVFSTILTAVIVYLILEFL